MNNLAFWNEWAPGFRVAFKVLLFLLLGFILTFLTIHWGDLSPFYYWKLTGYLENLSFPIFSNHSQLIESTVSTDLPVIFQKAFGGSNTMPAGYTYAYLILLYLGIVVCLTVATYLEKFWYFLGMGLWILLIMLSGIGKVGFFGFYDETPVILVVILFLSVSYYFNSINDAVGFGIRFLSFLGLMALTFSLLYFGSEYEYPLLFLARFSYLPATLICLIFILIIGHEIVYAILALTTPYSKSSSNNTTHFIILSLAYLLNLLALYLYRIDYLDWDIYYLNEFMVFGLSAVLGIWGIKSRENLYGRLLPFYPFTAIIFVTLGILTFATLAYHSFHANDPFVGAIRELILYSHIGFGSMFFLYIIGNFVTQLKQNLPVHQFAYVEDNFPYISARLAGVIVVAALFFRDSYSSFYKATAGYYNGLADLNLSLDREQSAIYYYKQSASKSTNNHHANFQLAQSEEKTSYRLAQLKNSIKTVPTPYAYASLGKEYESGGQFFDALFIYQDGLKKFPKHWALQNNLALLYNKTSVVDSAVYYLNNSEPGSWKQAVINANRAAVSAVHGLNLVTETDENLNRFDLQSNILANKIISGDTSRLAYITTPPSTTLNLFTYSYLKNLGIYCHRNDLPEFLTLINSYLEVPDNGTFRRDLILVKATNLYRSGKVAEAFELIYQLMELEEDQVGKWSSLLGKWCMELDAPMQASKYFETAREWGYPEASADLARAYDRLGDQSLALFLLSKESQSFDSTQSTQANAWNDLFEAMQSNQVTWTSYSFEKEHQMLDNARQTAAGKNLLYQSLGMDNPYYEEGIIAAANYFHEVEKDEETAYTILHQAITVNEYSEPLIKAYVDYCLTTGLIDFAEDAVARLSDLLDPDEFIQYQEAFFAKKQQAQSSLDQDW
ncbi:MAG: hypothetical protein ABJF11_07180 [Reichenbachiella sp.]|uniref:tetratricopeptide repeat protein n=1 Tax=Reichenbachiella sp. TaxID=2184521 RepID=UPI0032674991